MTQDEKEIAKAKEDIAEKGADSQTEKDRIDESVAAQERAKGDEDSQSAKDRVDESEGAKKADEKRAEEKREDKKSDDRKSESSALESKIDALVERMDKLISSFEARAEAKEDKMARAAEKYGLAPSGAGESPKKSFTDEDVKRLLG